jgi:hypothetical protein
VTVPLTAVLTVVTDAGVPFEVSETEVAVPPDVVAEVVAGEVTVALPEAVVTVVGGEFMLVVPVGAVVVSVGTVVAVVAEDGSEAEVSGGVADVSIGVVWVSCGQTQTSSLHLSHTITSSKQPIPLSILNPLIIIPVSNAVLRELI